jgi:Holliday junction resolvase RusA-like endonuclease
VTRLAAPARSWQSVAVGLLADEWDGAAPLDGPLYVGVEAVFARPQRLECSHKPPCVDRAWEKVRCSTRVLAGVAEPHVGVPDLTNIFKLAEDALTRAGVIVDDRLVCQQESSKRYARRGEQPHVTIEVAELAR